MATITGTNLNDVLNGGNADDLILGLAGNDLINAGLGNDTVEGGAGDDLMDGELGVDTLSYASAVSGVTVSLANKLAQDTGGAGIDTLSNFENLIGSAHDDVLTGTGGPNVIEGGLGNDTLDGAGGGDTASYAGAPLAVTVDLSVVGPQDTGGAGVDTLLNFQNLLGSAFNDKLTGDATANVIEGAAGNDTMNGADGLDTASYAGAASGVTVDLSLAGPQNTGGAGIDTLSNFENATGSAFSDTLTGTAGNNVLDGSAGVDTVSYANAAAGVRVNLSFTTGQNTVGAGIDTVLKFENLVGSNFNDTLRGTGGANLITGGTGADTIDTADGDDLADAGAGNDTVFAGLGNDTLVGGAGDDILYGDASSGALFGIPGLNRFTPFNKATTALQMATPILADNPGLSIDSASFTGAFSAASSFTAISYAPTISLGHGTLLTTGSGTPALTNTTFNFGIDNKVKGDLALDAVAQAAFAGAGRTQDATVLEVNFTVTDPAATKVGLDLIFGSEEFPEFVNSSFVDVAAVFIDGVNYALFNGDPLQPLSIIGNNVNNGNFLTNSAFPVEYDGLSSTLRVVGDLNPAAGVHTLRIAIADTGDGILDSALYVSNFAVSRDASGIELLAQDLISGGDGNDILDGGIGSDVLDGGAGADTASYGTADAGVTVNLGLIGPQNTVGAGIDTLSGIENLTGSDFNDSLTGDGGANVIMGGLGDDLLDGGAGVDTVSYGNAITGVSVSLGLAGAQDTVGAGIDTLSGFENLTGSTFNDTLAGDAGANVIDGGAGIDTASYAGAGGAVSVSLAILTAQNTVGAGLDTLVSIENLAGSAFNDRLTGNGGANVLTGGSGNDILNGAAGADTMAGGTGDDLYLVNSALDVAVENAAEGNDMVQASASYILPANVERLVLAGAGAINGTGNELGNMLTGNAGVNILSGGLGNDTLDGRAGVDMLRGGAGNDTLVFDAGDLEINGGGGTDALWVDATMTINLGALLGTGKLIDLEQLNLNGTAGAAVTVNLTVADVLDLSTTSNRLLVVGGAGDAVNAGAGWTQGVDQVIGAQTYASYTQGLATLLVDADIARTITA